MRGTGAAQSPSRNGGKQRYVEESEYFKLRCRALEPYVPRLREVLRGLHEQVAHNAEENAIEVEEGGPGKWVRKTTAGKDAPELWVYFSLTPDKCCLEYLVLPGAEPPTYGQDETML